MGAAPEKVTLLIGRIIVGLGIGMASMSVPVYLSESSLRSSRAHHCNKQYLHHWGSVDCICDLRCFFKSSTGLEVHAWSSGITFCCAADGLCVYARKPRWLILKGRLEEARQVLQKIRPADADIDGEVEAIMDVASNDVEEGNIAKVFQSAPVRRALFIGCLLQLFQQISGINTVMYYSASIISMAGVRDQSQAIWLAAATSSVNFFGTFIGLWLVERVGRRSLTLGSLLGSTASLLVLALSFQMAYIHSPDVLVPSTTDDCQASNCGVCTSRSECGFCFIGEVSNITNSSCVAADHSAFNEMSVSGVCANKTILEDDFAVFAYDWCPYQYAWISILGPRTLFGIFLSRCLLLVHGFSCRWLPYFLLHSSGNSWSSVRKYGKTLFKAVLFEAKERKNKYLVYDHMQYKYEIFMSVIVHSTNTKYNIFYVRLHILLLPTL
nr:proton myo-inositol cotransporter-like isoform X2 [Penaeus vannamei]